MKYLKKNDEWFLLLAITIVIFLYSINFLAGNVSRVAIIYQPSSQLADVSVSLNTTPWPKFFGQVGAYNVSGISEISAFKNAGFTLPLVGYPGPTSTIGTYISSNNMSQMVSLTHLLYVICQPLMSAGQPCNLSPSDQDRIVASAESIINQSVADPTVIGYYILDDYPNADIRPVLQRVHDLVVQSNSRAPFARPTICGFATVWLDYKDSPTDNFVYKKVNDIESLVNFSPTACDMIAIYPYGVAKANNPDLVDWSMNSVLPQILAVFKNHGWDQNRQPLIAVPHAFSQNKPPTYLYVLPRPSDMVAQIETFCRYGAISLIAYSWHDNASNGMSLYTNPSLLHGYQQGANICRSKYWGTASNVSQPPIVSTPTATPLITPLTTPGAPVISEILVSSIKTTGATISWHTDKPSTSQVSYGLTTNYGNNSVIDQNMRTYHTIDLNSLTPNTLYNFKLISSDNAGNTTNSSNYTFTTLSNSNIPITPTTYTPKSQVMPPTTPQPTKPYTKSPVINSIATKADFDAFLALVRAVIISIGTAI